MKYYEFDHTNADQLRERADARDAQDSGQETQYLSGASNEWIDRRDLEKNAFHSSFRYRRKPTPVAHPWYHPKHVPMPTCWMRSRHILNAFFFVTEVSAFGIVIGSHQAARKEWHHLVEWEHSTDGENWKPCTTLEP